MEIPVKEGKEVEMRPCCFGFGILYVTRNLVKGPFSLDILAKMITHSGMFVYTKKEKNMGIKRNEKR